MLIPRRPLAVQSRTPSIRGAFERGYGVGARGGTRGGARLRVSRKAPRGDAAPSRRGHRARGRAVRRRAGRRRAASALRPHVRDRRGRGCRVAASMRALEGGAVRLARGAGGRVARGVQGRVRRARGVRARVPPPTVRLAARVLWRRRRERARPETAYVPTASAGNAFTKRGTTASARWCTTGTRSRRRTRRGSRAGAAAAAFDARLAGTNARSAEAPGKRTRLTEPEETLNFDPEETRSRSRSWSRGSRSTATRCATTSLGRTASASFRAPRR